MSTPAGSLKRKRSGECSNDISTLKDMSSISYDQGVLDELIEYYRSKKDASGKDCNESIAEEMHCCTRAYEDSFLREPVGPERACARDQLCEGTQLTGFDGFVLREFLYPGQSAPQERQVCLLCRRYEISRMYFKYETNVSSPVPDVRISDHYNLVGVAGEYDIRDCIVSGENFTGLPMPVVLHIRSAYSSYTKDGVKCLQQNRMRCPGTADDDSTSSGSFLMRRAALEAKAARSNKRDQDESA